MLVMWVDRPARLWKTELHAKVQPQGFGSDATNLEEANETPCISITKDAIYTNNPQSLL